MNPEITLTQAIEWTTNWRNSTAYTNMGIKAFAFQTEHLQQLINVQQPDMVRFYLGVDAQGSYQLFYVGVDSDGKDMLNLIMDLIYPCPNCCDSISPLVG